MQLEIQKKKVELDGKVVLMLMLSCFLRACYSTRRQDNIQINHPYPLYFRSFSFIELREKNYQILIFHLLSFCKLYFGK